MKTIEFTEEELSALIQLLDIAVKAAGLNVAQAAAVLVAKINEQAGNSPELERTRVVTETEPEFAEADDSIEPPTEEEE